ncbi:hypothetical protein [Stenotrophomonas sp. 24(2023)]|uniref:hypothetical protein n=1 Tax=Stenotrophomonas sp. 24(2023) TaxID=3068324 RepID=UPI0027E12727|nr:hypothetical protein [Stenotrophomonas sp. 24(2023)]WMJ70984.1 hypothetical protein Q9R17_07760 [Stenotrophomonas sp. 24(2023)]
MQERTPSLQRRSEQVLLLAGMLAFTLVVAGYTAGKALAEMDNARCEAATGCTR